MIKRREFIAGIGSAAAWPVAARAQQPAVPVIGFLGSQSADLEYKLFTVPFLQGLKETGYVAGQNVVIEYRYAENQLDRVPALAADLVRRRVAVIIATGTTVAVPAKAATTTIPIVFAGGGDPVALGSCRQPQPARRERHGHCQFSGRAGAETIAIAPRVNTQCCPLRCSHEPGGNPIPPDRRTASGGAHAGPATPCCECRNG
jgi:hypothetical protein